MGRMAETTQAGIEPVTTERLKSSLRELLATLIDRAFGLALDDVVARGGLPLNALLGGARALHAGRNPVWGAIRGTFAAMSPAARAAVIAALVLAVLLLPLIVVLLLLALIVFAVWAAVRAASR
jgi:membrane associated rhomboid family serine protease